ncbi:MAG: signal peptidase II [Candidatus Acididesulfobacter guangdongensis]|uniref:Lipoprotein signal peptidase n=1 Tax=Acididesulfobacter guangdongensis TaxID=2597225 RepID=A0A519BJB3_ACIG2|nr:MAG: signal peptidase II [Candidatus Acididesulfobacter guangdongensis]
MKKKLLTLIAIFIPILIIDQLTKYIIAKNISFYGKITVIKHYFNIVHVDNTGIAFGIMGSASKYIIIFLTFAIIIALIYILFKVKINTNLFIISSALIISGAFSNLINRVVQGFVVDFIDIHIYQYHWPSFNVADSCVVVGTILFFLSIIKYI